MKRTRRVKRQRRAVAPVYTESEVRTIVFDFLKDRLKPEKHGLGEIWYNNSIPYFDTWFKENKK